MKNQKQKQIFKNKSHIRKSLIQGITNKERVILWKKYTNIQNFIQTQCINQDNKYQILCKNSHSDIQAIRKDIPRTLQLFQNSNNNKQNKQILERVLTALANRFPKIGYQSGMSYFVQRFINLLGEQFAYWFTVWIFTHDKILNNIFTQRQYYQLFIQFQKQILNKENSSFLSILEEYNLIQTYSIVWIKTLFQNALTTQLFYKMFDIYFLQSFGKKTLFFLPAAIFLSLNQKVVTSSNLFQEITLIFKEKLFDKQKLSQIFLFENIQKLFEKYQQTYKKLLNVNYSTDI